MNGLLLYRQFKTSLNYDKLAEKLKKQIGRFYEYGFIDKDEMCIYYLGNNVYTRNGMNQIPYFKINIVRAKGNSGLRIEFSLTNLALAIPILFPLIIIGIIYFAYAPMPIYYPLWLYPILYTVIYFVFITHSENFKNILKRWEGEVSSSIEID